MQAPSMHGYVRAYFTLYERFEQEQQNLAVYRCHPFDYEMKAMIFFFTLMRFGASKVSKLNGAGLHNNPAVDAIFPEHTVRFKGIVG